MLADGMFDDDDYSSIDQSSQTSIDSTLDVDQHIMQKAAEPSKPIQLPHVLFFEKCLEHKRASMITKDQDTIPLHQIPEKLPDPGNFTLECTIFHERFDHSLCDLGSGVNLMPYTVARRMGFLNYHPTNISLILADKSVRHPEGMLKDIPVRIRNCIIPTDFIILRYDKEPKDPIILGRPFLATAGAMIDCKEGSITLHIGNVEMHFKMNETTKPTIDGQTFHEGTLTGKEDQGLPVTNPPTTRSKKKKKPERSKKKEVPDDPTTKHITKRKTPRSFHGVKIIIPPELRNEEEIVIMEKLQKTMDLFVNAVWEKQDGRMVAKGKCRMKLLKDKGDVPLRDQTE